MLRIKDIIFFVLILSLTSHSQDKTPGKWETVFEKSGYISTADYEQTMEYFGRFAKEFPEVSIMPFGESPQGRRLMYLVVSESGITNPADARKAGLPVVLITNGIHSGEIEGKDACMLLLRDILVTREKAFLLKNAVLVIVPIFSVDGHERKSKYNRINQDGPEEMGWRTTAQNLNLNRDWVKADTPEMQAMLRLFNLWMPDYYIDTHTTDGADYQYSVTYGLDKFQNLYPGLAGLVRQELIPHLVKRVEEQGFLISPYVGFRAGQPDSGLVDWPSTPRFSNGYATVQNRIGLLVETHMMKPYKERVFATKAILTASLEFVNANSSRLTEMNREADEVTIGMYAEGRKHLPLLFRVNNKTTKFLYKGIEAIKESSVVSGAQKLVYTGKKYGKEVPYYNDAEVVDSVLLPYAYVIPPEYSLLAERLVLHGVRYEVLQKDSEAEVTKYKFKNVKFSASPYEGRQTVTCGYDNYVEKTVLKKGSYIIKPAQRSIKLIAMALEPKSGDSFLRWGFMNAIFEHKEYYEDYVMEKVALEMLEADKELETEFNKKLAEDDKFRNDPDARLNFFYERSPYFDKQKNVYPVVRIEKRVDF
ncbi:MAG: hypothetical protein HUU54_16155 [Ignavibacteriaceae bacterium]|nr:hypothetical protein [Ignavibacteriaceae bacterium]